FANLRLTNNGKSRRVAVAQKLLHAIKNWLVGGHDRPRDRGWPTHKNGVEGSAGSETRKFWARPRTRPNLSRLSRRDICQGFRRLRLVGAIGIEPVTPTMSR